MITPDQLQETWKFQPALISFDIGSDTGVVIVEYGKLWDSRTLRLDPKNWPETLIDFQIEVSTVLRVNRIQTVVIEASRPRQHKLKDLYTTAQMLASMEAFRTGAACREIHPATARKAVFGHGNVCRDEVLPMVLEAGWSVEDKHQADALVVALAHITQEINS